ncbi:MAG: DUF1344 domain-containing protein [Rhizobiaceae bacterium]|nr:DUF1344 domain-containing protein [Rhizobiaceae bacterium]MCV0405620.1 DUF1344 domain-containing protein [Rhizobiaceae bacterium]
MRTLIAAIAFTLAGAIAPALAAEAEGTIQSVDRETLVITLSDGKTYKLPAEIDVTAVEEGMSILAFYEEVDGQNLITDMQLFSE